MRSGDKTARFPLSGNVQRSGRLVAAPPAQAATPLPVWPYMQTNAAAAWSAEHYDSDRDALVDVSGNHRHARLGSAVGADANDPVVLLYEGEKYLWLPGAHGNNNQARLAHDDKLNLIDGIDLRIRLNPGSWTSPTYDGSGIVMSRFAADPDRLWFLALDGTLRLVRGIDGTAAGGTVTHSVSPSAITLANNTPGWLRVRWVGDDGNGDNEAVFYQSVDGVDWTQIGPTQVVSGTAALAAGTPRLEVGGWPFSSVQLRAKIYRAQMYDVSGTLIADFNPQYSEEPHTSFYNPNTDETWTISRRSSAGRKLTLVDRSLLSFGTDQYLEVPNAAALEFGADEDATVVWVGRLTTSHADMDNQALISKKADHSTAVGYAIDRGANGLTPRVMLADGTNNPTATTPVFTAGQSTLAALVRNGGLIGYRNDSPGTAVTDTTGDTSSGGVLRIGRLSGEGTAYADMEFIGAATFRRALTASELEDVANLFIHGIEPA